MNKNELNTYSKMADSLFCEYIFSKMFVQIEVDEYSYSFNLFKMFHILELSIKAACITSGIDIKVFNKDFHPIEKMYMELVKIKIIELKFWPTGIDKSYSRKIWIQPEEKKKNYNIKLDQYVKNNIHKIELAYIIEKGPFLKYMHKKDGIPISVIALLYKEMNMKFNELYFNIRKIYSSYDLDKRLLDKLFQINRLDILKKDNGDMITWINDISYGKLPKIQNK